MRKTSAVQLMCHLCAGLWHVGSAQMEAGGGVGRGLALLCPIQLSSALAAIVQPERLEVRNVDVGDLSWPGMQYCVLV